MRVRVDYTRVRELTIKSDRVIPFIATITDSDKHAGIVSTSVMAA